MTEEMGLRDRKKLERRRHIEAAAIGLFEANGFEQTTTDDIAARADIAPRTFFHYFPTKEDVVLADYAARLAQITAELAELPLTTGPWASLRAAFVVVAADYDAQRDELVRRFVIIADNPSVYARSLQLQAGWEDTITVVLAERTGADAADITPSLMASAAMACMRSALRHWMLTNHRDALPTLVEMCFDQLTHGYTTTDVGRDRGEL